MLFSIMCLCLLHCTEIIKQCFGAESVLINNKIIMIKTKIILRAFIWFGKTIMLIIKSFLKNIFRYNV